MKESMSEKKGWKNIPKAFNSHLVEKKEWKISRIKRIKSKRGKKNKMVYGKNKNEPSISLIIDYKALTKMSNIYYNWDAILSYWSLLLC